MVEVPCNVGGTERPIRLGMGAALVGISLLAPIPRAAKVAAGVLGTMEIITGVARYCPVNQALHINTCRAEDRPQD